MIFGLGVHESKNIVLTVQGYDRNFYKHPSNWYKTWGVLSNC